MKKHTLVHKSRRLRRFLRANEAVSALEYAVLVGIVGVALAVGIAAFGDKITTAMTNLGAGITATPSAGPLGTAPSPTPF